MNADVVDILPPVHGLTGYYITSKVCKKPAALKTRKECSYELVCFFDNTKLTDEIISHAKKIQFYRVYLIGI